MRYLLVLLLGCASTVTTTPSPTDGATDSATDTATSDTAVDSAPSDVAMDAPSTCFPGGTVPVTPFKRCTSAADCVTASHQTDCCGNSMVIGIAKSEKAAFDTCEAASRAAFPACGCPASPATAEDGTMIDGSMPVPVRCGEFVGGSGVCRTGK